MANNDNKPLFCEGVYPSVIKTQYGEIINLKIDIDKLRRNLTVTDDNGRECIFAQIKTGKDGGKYAVINLFKYPNRDAAASIEDEEIPF